MELLRQRAQTLGQQRNALDVDADLLSLGLEHIARNADDIADVVFPEVRELLGRNGVRPDIELQLAPVVLYVAENGLAHAALGHDPARNLDGLALQLLIVCLYLRRPRAPNEPSQLEGSLPPPCSAASFAADLQYLESSCSWLLVSSLIYPRPFLMRSLRTVW